jgi:YD repeat-containing protein
MVLRNKLATGIVLAALLGAAPALATETINYTYDARGRLVKVVHTGTVNNNNQACYKYDKADNRNNVQANVGSLPACP